VSRRVLIAVVVASLGLLLNTPAVWANDGLGGDGGGSATASTGPGKVTVGVGVHHHPRPRPTSTTPTTTPPSGGGSPGPALTTDPITCTLVPVNLPQFQQSLGIGGPKPGYWAIDECTGPNGPIPHPPVWIVIAQPGTPTTPGVVTAPPPVVVAQQAEKQLDLPAITIDMAPPPTSPQLVNVSTWLWLDPVAWKPYSATAAIDGVAATATATPEKVVWNMGDGSTITCDGPGTPYDPAEPNATSGCTYTWTTPSDAEPDGAYDVSATTVWEVTWTVVGAPGGGNLGLVAGPAADVDVNVTESQAINTPTNP
jgi:hypothetical protein